MGSQSRYLRWLAGGLALVSGLIATSVLAHGIAGDDQAFLLRAVGGHIGPYMYLGAKHMVTGYDHLLFLAGVIFFLYRLKDVALYVTLFAVGHSATLLLGEQGTGLPDLPQYFGQVGASQNITDSLYGQ